MRNKISIEELSKKISFYNDIDSIQQFNDIDKLIETKQKFASLTKEFKQEIQNAPESLKTFLKTKNLELFLDGLFEKFHSNTINISVVAEVSSGKSTFLNALIFGKKILDAKMGETTAKVFKISYGKNQNLEELKQEISKINSETKHNIDNDKILLEDIKIDDYIIELKADNENLKKDIVLYDTPGFGTLNEKIMSKLIQEAINRSDAVILLLDISKGLKKGEAQFIQEALSYIKENKRFIVLNKFDASIDEDDDPIEIQQQIDKVVQDTKKELITLSNNNIDTKTLDNQTYYLSALKALSGKFKNDAKKLDESRFKIFEDSFWSRIIESKKETFNDSINNLLYELTNILNESNDQVKNFSNIIHQTNAIIENINTVSNDIKKLVKKHTKDIDEIIQVTDNQINFVMDKSRVFQNEMNSILQHNLESMRVSINNIPINSLIQDDFQRVFEQIQSEITSTFNKNLNIFREILINNIDEKEKMVNSIIDNINNDMQDAKFKKLHLKQIPKVMFTISNQDNILLKSKIDVDFNNTAINTTINNEIFSSKNSDDIVTNAAAGATVGGTAGAAIGSVVPIVGTTIGAAIGTTFGGILGAVFGGGDDNKHKAKIAEMEKMLRKREAEHQERILQMKIDAVKQDFFYKVSRDFQDDINKSILEISNKADKEYRNILSNITSLIYNAKNILKEMQIVIENPDKQKKIVDENQTKIKELDDFTKKIFKSLN